MNREIFEALLETSRALRRKRRERRQRITRLMLTGGLAQPRDPAADEVDVRAIRAATGLSQAKFAELLGIELATLRNWEQRRREPTGPGRALLRAIRNRPIDVIRALSD
jgi:putative transcriptional regulator